MSDNPFYRLAPFIQEYIYRAGWTELRAIQVQTANAIFDTPGHVLITSGTASGKTEAAFLPVITSLYNQPSTGIGAMYIGPLKALLNDQFQRLQLLLQESHIPVQTWHGDVESSRKQRFVRDAQGILQITPESLEALLLQPIDELTRLFGDLRFVIIDEVHAFIASDRGRQVICHLQRLGRLQKQAPRRVGLSATLGDPQLAMTWLAGGTSLPVTLINDTVNRREILLGLEHYPIAPRDLDEQIRRALAAEAQAAELARQAQQQAAEKEAQKPAETGESSGEGKAESDKAPDAEPRSKDGVPVPPEESAATPHKATEPTTLSATQLQKIAADAEAFYQDLYDMTRRDAKTLIFANSRGEVETVVGKLRELAAKNKQPDIYFPHHGSISKPMRQTAEEAMREPGRPACVVATMTLELGIDLGQLDQVLQIRAPGSVASFVQRLGRSGRRGNAAKMFFYSRERVPQPDASLARKMPWDLLQAVATIELYLGEKWIESAAAPQFPFSLLYHQTMSILAANTELPPPQLAEQVLTLAPFAAITQDQYRTLLQHLLTIGHIARTETGTLIVGLAGEKIINRYQFYATFKDESTFVVRHGAREIGSIQIAPAKGKLFILGGNTWKATEVNTDSHVIFAEPSAGQASPQWMSGTAQIHARVLERIRQVLQEDMPYRYLRERAAGRLQEARQQARLHGLATAQIVPLNEDRTRYAVLPWQSTRVVKTVIRMLELHNIKVIESGLPYYFEISVPDITVEAVQHELASIAANPPTGEELLAALDRKSLESDKYDEFIPEALLKQAFVADRLDLPGAVACLAQLGGGAGAVAATSLE